MNHSASGRNVGAFGMSAGFPCGAPLSAHRTIVLISSSESDRSFLYWRMPTVLSRCQGGMSRLATRWRIDWAHGRASSYDTSDMGADVPAWWHASHLAWKMGATSRENVTGSCAVVAAPVRPS